VNGIKTALLRLDKSDMSECRRGIHRNYQFIEPNFDLAQRSDFERF